MKAHAEGTPSGASPERPSRDASLCLPRKDDGERVRGRAVQIIYKTGRKLNRRKKRVTKNKERHNPF